MNQNKDNEFDRQLRGKFENFTPEVSTELWGKIEAQLDSGPHDKVVPIANRRKGLPAWLKVAAAVLLITSGVAYWYSRPVEVTYLQARVTLPENEQETPITVDATEEPIVVVKEPLDVERLKRLFAKKESRTIEVVAAEGENLGEERAAEEVDGPFSQWAAATDTQPQVIAVPPVSTPEEAASHALEETLAKVPDIQPLVVLDEEEETMLASTGDKQVFGLSNILNYVVGTVDQREEKVVTFSNDSEGSLKLDFNFGLAKNKKKKIN